MMIMKRTASNYIANTTDGVYIGVPHQTYRPGMSLIVGLGQVAGNQKDTNDDEEHQQQKNSFHKRPTLPEGSSSTATDENHPKLQVPIASCLMSAVHIITFIFMTAKYGLAPHSKNCFIGSDLSIIRHLFDDNDTKQKFSLVLLSNFMSLGFIPLVGIVLINIQLGYYLELERRWGGYRWIFVYLFSGIVSKSILMAVKPHNYFVFYMGLGHTFDAVIGVMLVELLYSQLFQPTTRDDSDHYGSNGKEDHDEKEGLNLKFIYLSTLAIMLISQVTYFSFFSLSLLCLIFSFKSAFIQMFLYNQYVLIKSKST